MRKHKIQAAACAALLAVSVFTPQHAFAAEESAEYSVERYNSSWSDYNTEAGFKYTISGESAVIMGYTGNAKEVTIPSNLNGYMVTAIGECAFEGSSIRTISMPDTVTEIGDWAFMNTKSLVAVTLSCNLTKIGSGAFSGSALASVHIPKTLTECGMFPFNDCRDLVVTMESGIAKIPDSLFKHAGISRIVIPNSVAEIGEGAFEGCTGLKTISLPDSLKTIGENAFEGASITSVKIPNTVTAIASGAFANCTNLSSIKLPAIQPEMGERVFANTAITALPYTAGYTISEGAFCSTGTLRSLSLTKVSKIGSYAFWDCSNLKTLKISGDVKDMGTAAFAGCKSLSKIVFGSGLTSIPPEAFKNCTSLAVVTIPANITSIDEQAFAYDSALKDVYIPVAVTSIADNAFEHSRAVTIHAPKGSYGAQYAKEHGIKCVSYIAPLVDVKTTAYNNRIAFAWKEYPETSYYKVYKKVNGAWKALTGTTEFTYTDSSVKAGQTYMYRIQACDDNKNPIAEKDITVSTKGTVKNITQSTDKTTAKLSWNKYSGATSYQVHVYMKGKWVEKSKVKSTSAKITGLVANTSYKLRVGAFDSKNKLIAYTIVTAKTKGSVAGVKAATYNNSAALSWTKFPGVAYYNILRWNGKKWVVTNKKVTANNCAVTGLAANTSYKLRIAAYNKSNTLLAYTDVTAKTKAKISGFRLSYTRNGEVLNWSKVSGAAYYKVSRCTGNNYKWSGLSNKLTKLTYTDKTCKTGIVYTYRVAAYNRDNKIIADALCSVVVNNINFKT